MHAHGASGRDFHGGKIAEPLRQFAPVSGQHLKAPPQAQAAIIDAHPSGDVHMLTGQRRRLIVNFMTGHDKAAIALAIGGEIKPQSFRMGPGGARHPVQINDIIDVIEIINIALLHGEAEGKLRWQ